MELVASNAHCTRTAPTIPQPRCRLPALAIDMAPTVSVVLWDSQCMSSLRCWAKPRWDSLTLIVAKCKATLSDEGEIVLRSIHAMTIIVGRAYELLTDISVWKDALQNSLNVIMT